MCQQQTDQVLIPRDAANGMPARAGAFRKVYPRNRRHRDILQLTRARARRPEKLQVTEANDAATSASAGGKNQVEQIAE